MMPIFGKATNFLKSLRALDSDMPLAQAHCLLIIAQHEGLSVKELADRAGIGMASASRYISLFSKPPTPGRKGLGLVEAREDPLERRKKIVRLTPKGATTVKQIMENL